MIKKTANSKEGRKSCLEAIDKDSYQLKVKNRNKRNTYMNKYAVMTNKILNTISNRRDIKVPVHSGKYKAGKQAKNSRNGVSSLRSASSNSNRIPNFNKYITMMSAGLPYGPRNASIRKLNSNSSKKIKKSGSRQNSSALSMYNDHKNVKLKLQTKENVNNVSLNSY